MGVRLGGTGRDDGWSEGWRAGRTAMWVFFTVPCLIGMVITLSLRVSALDEQVGRLEQRADRQTLVVKHYQRLLGEMHDGCVDAGVCEEDK